MVDPKIPIIVLVVVVAAVGLYFYPNILPQTSYETETDGEVSEGAETITGLQIAERTLEFIEGTEDETGEISSVIECDLDGTNCRDFGAEFATDVSLFSLAYRDMHDATGDGKYLALADKEFEGTITRCTEEGFCGISAFGSILDSYERTGNEEHKEILINSEASWVESSELGFDDIAIDSSEKLAVIYRLNGDESTLAKSEEILSAAKSRVGPVDVDELGLQPLTTIRNTDCAIQSANLELYKSTEKGSYLEEATEFFDQHDLAKDSIFILETKTMIDCSNALLDLSEITGDGKYREEAEAVAGVTIVKFWDVPEKPKFSPDDGFVAGVGIQHVKNIRDSMRMISLMSNFKESGFSLEAGA